MSPRPFALLSGEWEENRTDHGTLHSTAFLTVPSYSLFLSLRNHAPWHRRELYMLVAISCIGWVTNHFTARAHPYGTIPAAVGHVSAVHLAAAEPELTLLGQLGSPKYAAPAAVREYGQRPARSPPHPD